LANEDISFHSIIAFLMLLIETTTPGVGRESTPDPTLPANYQLDASLNFRYGQQSSTNCL
jgi:hypothetical protein